MGNIGKYIYFDVTVLELSSNMRTELTLCEIWSYHGGGHEDYSLLGRDVVYVQTFQKNLQPPLSHDQTTPCQIPEQAFVRFSCVSFCGPRVYRTVKTRRMLTVCKILLRVSNPYNCPDSLDVCGHSQPSLFYCALPMLLNADGHFWCPTRMYRFSLKHSFGNYWLIYQVNFIVMESTALSLVC